MLRFLIFFVLFAVILSLSFLLFIVLVKNIHENRSKCSFKNVYITLYNTDNMIKVNI